MQDVAREGDRTVLFVSHMMASVLQLCNRCIYLVGGQVKADGPANEVITTYIQSGQAHASEATWALQDAPGTELVKMLGVRALDKNGMITGDYNIADDFVLELEFAVLQGGAKIGPSFQIFNDYNVCVCALSNVTDPQWGQREYAPGVYKTQCRVPGRFLNDGNYSVTAVLVRDFINILAFQEKVVTVQVHEDGTGRGGYTGPWMGVTRPDFPWTVERVTEK